jgi:hypothetical protein
MPLNIKGNVLSSSDVTSVGVFKSKINRDGLICYLDAASLDSYPGAGTTWIDLSSGGHNGTLTNCTFSSSNGGIFTLNGSSSYVDLGTFFNYQYFTISLWIYPGASQNTYADIFDNYHTGTQNLNCQQNVDVLNQYNSGVSDGSTWSVTSLFSLASNTWCNLTFTFDGKMYRGYTNATLFSTGSPITSVNYVTPSFSIGRWSYGNSRFWNGSVANFLIYDRYLNPYEVAENFQATRGRFGI